jgi:hypothetical protein
MHFVAMSFPGSPTKVTQTRLNGHEAGRGWLQRPSILLIGLIALMSAAQVKP